MQKCMYAFVCVCVFVVWIFSWIRCEYFLESDIEEKINETDELIDKAQAEVKRLLDYKVSHYIVIFPNSMT